jgi:hypothetical protein
MDNNTLVQELLNNACPSMAKSNSHSKWNYACIDLHCRFMHVVWTYLNGSGIPNIYHFEVTEDDSTPKWVHNACEWD